MLHHKHCLLYSWSKISAKRSILLSILKLGKGDLPEVPQEQLQGWEEQSAAPAGAVSCHANPRLCTPAAPMQDSGEALGSSHCNEIFWSLKKAQWVLLLSQTLWAESCPRPLCDIILHHIYSPNNLRGNKAGKQRAFHWAHGFLLDTLQEFCSAQLWLPPAVMWASPGALSLALVWVRVAQPWSHSSSSSGAGVWDVTWCYKTTAQPRWSPLVCYSAPCSQGPATSPTEVKGVCFLCLGF